MIRPGIKKLFRLAFHRREDAARDVNEEMRLHIALRAEQLIGGGMAPEQARAIAEQKFGSNDDVQRMMSEAATHREGVMRKRDLWESFTQDLRYVLRSLRRSPTFVISATLTLALGLGANAALFSVLDRLYLQDPPGVVAPSQLRRFFETTVGDDHVQRIRPVLSPPEFLSVEEVTPRGATIVGYRTDPAAQLGNDDAAPIGAMSWVLGDYFGVLGARPTIGRNFSAEEVRPKNIAMVAIVSDAFARRQFGDPRNALDKSLDVGSSHLKIVGVAPRGFHGTDLDDTQLWVPMNILGAAGTSGSPWWEESHSGFVRSFVRAPDNATFAAFTPAAAQALKRATIRPDTANIGATLGSIRDMLSPGFNTSEAAIATRLGVVAFVILLIACANVTNLLLSRAMQRRREIGVRLALGVSRARLISQLLTESVVLAAIGTVAAVLMAIWCGTALRHALLPDMHWSAPAVGWRVIGFALLMAIVAGIAAGLAPALHASRPNLTSVLRGGARDGGGRRSRLRTALLVSQVALSCVLLAGAGLFVRSLRQVEAIDIGYDTDQIVFARIGIKQGSGRARDDVAPVLTEAAGRIAKLPGVDHVSFAAMTPMRGFSMQDTFRENGDSLKSKQMMETVSFVSPEYFSAMGMRVLQGRGFSVGDREGSELVVVVNATFAKTAWPGEAAIGKCFRLSKSTETCRRVVGVVSNAHWGGTIEAPAMAYYVPLLQQGRASHGTPGDIEIHTAPGRAPQVAGDVKKLLTQMSSTGMRPIVTTLAEQLEPGMRSWKLGAALFTAAGLLALLVAAVGIYGTIAYTFSQRTHEIGVRIALGAQSSSIIALVLKSSVVISAIGVIAGTGIALWAGKFAKPLLYETSPANPFVLGGVGVGLLLVAVLASLVPAMRAKRVDPMEALRAE